MVRGVPYFLVAFVSRARNKRGAHVTRPPSIYPSSQILYIASLGVGGVGVGRCTMHICIQVGCDLDVDACGALTKSLDGGEKGVDVGGVGGESTEIVGDPGILTDVSKCQEEERAQCKHTQKSKSNPRPL